MLLCAIPSTAQPAVACWPLRSLTLYIPYWCWRHCLSAEAQRQALLASRYRTLLAPATHFLDTHLRTHTTKTSTENLAGASSVGPGNADNSSNAAQPGSTQGLPQTPHERDFNAKLLPLIRAAAKALRAPVGVSDWGAPTEAWAPLRRAAQEVARALKAPLPQVRIIVIQFNVVKVDGMFQGQCL